MRFEFNEDAIKRFQDNFDHLSPTMIREFLGCGMKTYFKRVLGMRTQPGALLYVGTAAHAAAEENRCERMDTGEWLSTEDAKGIAAAVFEAKVEQENPQFDEGQGKGACLDLAVAHAEMHAKELAPCFEPTHVEQPFELDIDDISVPVTGYIDVIGVDESGQVIVRDFKTTGRKMPMKQTDLIDNPQFGIYAMAVEEATGEPVSVGAEVSHFRRLKTKTEHLAYDVESSNVEHLKDRATAQAVAVDQSIAAGIFPPSPPSSFLCSEKYCDYHKGAGGPCPFGR